MMSITSFELSVAASVEATAATMEAAAASVESAAVESAKAGLSTGGVAARHTAMAEPAEGAGMNTGHWV
jgi:hypothetical protein